MPYRNFTTVVLLCFICFAHAANAQQRPINGKVMDSATQMALSLASVAIVNTEGTILHYTFTDDRGNFSLMLPSGTDSLSLWLRATYVGYHSRQAAIMPYRSSYQLLLAKDTNRLKEVVVRTPPPIKQLGDTIRYNVEAFAEAEDRSIGDVLKHMPGIEIAVDGTIYYNGEKIFNLYIQGDDLMNGRYGAATRSIRKDMIKSIDIIRNFQPVKVLKDKIHSDKTALNLQLRDPHSLKLSVNAMAGGGFPKLYDAAVTGILLNDQVKALNKIALNNSGVDYSNNFKQLGTANLISSIGDDPSRFDLSLATIGPPDLPLPNYYFNHSGIINFNNLYKTKKEVKFKVNIQAFKDRNSLDYLSRTDNYLDHDTISYNEQQALMNHKTLWNTSLNVRINKDRYFFNNDLNVGIADDDNTSFMDFNDNHFSQNVNKKIRKFSNNLDWMPALPGKGIGELRWLIRYDEDEQSLDIGKGYHLQIPDAEGNYDKVIQGLTTPTLFSNFYLGYKRPGAVINQEYTAGISITSKDLHSDLKFIEQGADTSYPGHAGNDLHWRQHNIYFTARYQKKGERLKSTLNLPVSYKSIHYYQREYNLNKKKIYLFFNPSLKVDYEFDPEHFLNFSYVFSNHISDIFGVYRGGILKNYRTFMANDANLQHKSTHSLAVTFKFQESIDMLFFNTGVNYDRTAADAMRSTEFINDIQKTIFLPYPNKQSHFSLHAGVSKYLFNLKSTVSLNARWSRYRYMEMINNKVHPFHSNSLSFRGKVMKKIGAAITLVYKPTGIWNTAHTDRKENGTAGLLSHHAFRLDQRLSLQIKPVKGINISSTARHSFSKESNQKGAQYFFMDAKIMYSSTSKRIDLSLSVNNIFNVTTYVHYALAPYQLTKDLYNIRGRMGMIRLNYYF